MSTKRDGKRPQPSPAATEDAGGLFQARVGAHCLLTLLAEASPRGLPGSITRTVKYQQAAAGHPLDDIVLEGESPDGSIATLDIQAKRTLDFTRSDREFAEIAAALWRTSLKPEFQATRYELAVAIERSSTRIERSCKEVLAWARSVPSGKELSAHLELFASAQQRDFVEAFSAHLTQAGATADDDLDGGP